jgi:hypothetical protein
MVRVEPAQAVIPTPPSTPTQPLLVSGTYKYYTIYSDSEDEEDHNSFPVGVPAAATNGSKICKAASFVGWLRALAASVILSWVSSFCFLDSAWSRLKARKLV